MSFILKIILLLLYHQQQPDRGRKKQREEKLPAPLSEAINRPALIFSLKLLTFSMV